MIDLKKFRAFSFHLFVPIMLLITVYIIVPEFLITYNALVKHKYSLPGIIFFILYSLMYILFGVSAFLIDSKKDTKEINYYYITVLMNLFFIPIYFGLRLFLLGSIWVAILLILVVFVQRKFRKHNKLSANLLIPYIMYLCYLLFLLIFTYINN